MTIEEKNKLVHWNYFLAFDSDAEKLSRYIEFTKKNEKTFSIELVRLLLSAASEVDVVAKLLCKKMSPDEPVKNMKDCREILNKKCPNIKKMKIQIPRYGFDLTPWINWKHKDRTPIWWKDYNEVKHRSDKYFQKANLKNTLNSIAGLFCLVLYYYKDEAETGSLRPHPNLFSVSDEFRGGYDIDESGFYMIYKL